MSHANAPGRPPSAPVGEAATTSSPEEVARFTAMAEAWWDPTGKFKPLHKFNPVRLAFMRRVLTAHFGRDPETVAPFTGLTLLDIGCGGGLLSEPLARMGFAVTGIDAGARNVAVARAHAAGSELAIDYRVATPEQLDGSRYDVVLAMEVVEHVPDPRHFLGVACACVAPGGAFLGATLNRTTKAYALAVMGAEYILRWLPKGTHDWHKFLKPAEFAAALRAAGIEVRELRGMAYAPLRDEWHETAELDVNYMLYGARV